MLNYALRIGVNALAIWMATLIVPQVQVTQGTTTQTVTTMLILGLIFGLLNTFIRPVIDFLSLPFYFVTFGLFAVVVNALMLKLVEWLSGYLSISFSTGPFFWSTLAASIVISLVSALVALFLPGRGH